MNTIETIETLVQTTQELRDMVFDLQRQVREQSLRIQQLTEQAPPEESIQDDVSRLQRTMHAVLNELFDTSHQPKTHARYRHMLYGETGIVPSDFGVMLDKLRYEKETNACKTEWVSATTNQGRYLEDCVSNIEDDVMKNKNECVRKYEQLEEVQENQAAVIHRLIDGLFHHGMQEREIESLRSQLNGDDDTESPEVFFPTTRQGDRIQRRLDYLEAMLTQHGIPIGEPDKYPLGR
jgi:hypothetical protein